MAAPLRLFFALWPDEPVRSALAGFAARLPGRPTRAEDLHLTLAFLGAQPDGRVAELTQLLAALPAARFTLRLDRLAYFDAPRVAWAGCSTTPAALLALESALRGGLDALAIERRTHAQYTPHVTLARDSIDPAALAFTPLDWCVSRMGLAMSDPQADGARYRVLAERTLD